MRGGNVVAALPTSDGDPVSSLSGPPFGRVLYASDLTPTSDACAGLAYALVADRGAVHAVHVHPSVEGSSHGARAALEAAAPREAVDRGVRTLVHLLPGDDAAAEILRVAARVGAEVVVVGTRARGGIARIVWGSVAERVARGAAVVTLLARSGGAKARGGSRPRSVLAPVELSPFEADGVRIAYGLVADGGVVHLLHVWSVALAPAGDEDVAFPYRPRGAEREAHERSLHERLLRLAPREAARRRVRTVTHVTESDRTVAEIDAAAKDLDVDLVVLATHGRTGAPRLWAPSVAEKVAGGGRAAVVVHRPHPARTEAAGA
jgi:nucleotide-binding universal stress UspA family protein